MNGNDWPIVGIIGIFLFIIVFYGGIGGGGGGITIDINQTGGGGDGNISGGGIPDRVAKFQDVNHITNANIFSSDDGNIGINTAVTDYKLTINGPTGINNYIDMSAIATTPPDPAASSLRLYSQVTQGFTRLIRKNESPTPITIGRDNVFVVKNVTGATLNKLAAVYVNGSQGRVPTVDLAKADSNLTLPALGLIVDSIPNNGFGYVMKIGVLELADTNGLPAGTELWVSPFVAGGLTIVRPGFPYFAQRAAEVISGLAPTTGSVLVNLPNSIFGQDTGTIQSFSSSHDLNGFRLCIQGDCRDSWASVGNGNIDGNGTPNFTPRFLDNNTLGDSNVWNNPLDGNVGIKTQITPNTLSINGNIGINEYIDINAMKIGPPVKPVSGVIRVYSVTTRGFTRLVRKNEAPTDVTISRDNIILAQNTSGSTILKGKPVYITGALGDIPLIALSKADSNTTLPAIGVALDNITNLAFGQIMKLGIITDLNTSGFIAGQQVWVSPTVAGGLTNVRPTFPNYVHRIGSILTANAVTGSMLVYTTPFIGGEETSTNSQTYTANDVNVTGVLVGQVIISQSVATESCITDCASWNGSPAGSTWTCIAANTIAAVPVATTCAQAIVAAKCMCKN